MNEPPTFDDARVSRILGLGLSPQDSPAERLAERLSASDGEAWLERTLAALLGEGHSPDDLRSGQLSLAELEIIKRRGKERFREGGEALLVGTAGYFFAVAAAWVHHEAMICSQPRAELDAVLERLVEVAPPRWSELLLDALERSGP